MTTTLTQIYRYPVKGLNGESLDSVELGTGEGLPHDRRFALAHAASKFDKSDPQWMAKENFLVLMRDARLALLDARFDPDSGMLTIKRDGRQVARGDITQPLGRTLVEQFLGAFVPPGPRGDPHIVEVPGAMLSDKQEKLVSIINLASVRDVERVAGAPVDPRRYRANFYIDGADAWAEMNWVGSEIRIGGARLEVTAVIDRCAAIEVNPDNAERDLHLLRMMQRGFGHIDSGVYARVRSGGAVAPGDEVLVV